MKRRIWSTFFVVIFLIALVPAAVMAYDPVGDGVLPPPESYDIFINVDEGFGMAADVFNTLLREKLLEFQGQPNGVGGTYNSVTDTDIKTFTNVTTIDTTNLDGWYVYDNYNYDTGTRPGYWSVANNLKDADGNTITKEQAWMNNYKMSSTTDNLRPAFFITDSNATSSAYNTIEEIVSTPALLAANWKTSHRLKEHIYSYIDDAGKPGMWFFGYGTWSIADFLFYPTTSTGTKNVKFTVDSNYVYTHALDGAGFLFNTGIDTNGYIRGYYAYYKFSSATAVSRLSIYKINDNVPASHFHNGTSGGGNELPGSALYPNNISAANRIASYCTEIAYVANPTWNSITSIEANMTTTTLTISQGPNSSSRVPVNFTLTAASGQSGSSTTVPLSEAVYHGFGPLVQYSGSGHTCYEGSAFKFCDLEMSFYEPADDKENTVLDSLSNADFIKNSEKYFINLLSLDSSPNLSTSDWEAMARMRENEIYYLTNVQNPYLNDGGYVTSDAPMGDNGFSALTSLLGGLTEDDGQAYYEKLAEEIAKYILSGKAWKSNNLPALQTPTPVGMFYLMAKNPNPLNPVEVQVYDIVRNYITAPAGVQIYTDDHSDGGYKDSNPIKVVSREYIITYPDGTIETVTITGNNVNSKKDNLLVIYGNSQLGTYTVTLTVTNAEGDVSVPVTLKFTVGEDTDPPVISWITPANNTTLFETPDTPVKVTLSDISTPPDHKNYGIAAYQIGYKYPGDTAPIYNKEVYVASYPNYLPTYDLTINIPIGVYELWIQAWDGAGRLTTEFLSVDNRYDISQSIVTVGGEVIDDIYYPETVVKYNGKTLRHGIDYTLDYQHVTGQQWNAVVTGIGLYKNSKSEGFVNPTSSGLFIIIVHGVGEDAPTGLYGKGYASILSDEHFLLLKTGHNVLIDIYVDRVDEDMVRNEHFPAWVAIWHTFGNNSRPNLWLDITAFITITSYPKEQVFEFYDDIKITMDLPMSALPKKGQRAILSYSHNDVGGKISDIDEDLLTGTFGIRNFSFFALSYKSHSGSLGSANVVQTGDGISLTLPIIAWVTSGTSIFAAATVKYRKRRKTQNPTK